MPCLESEKELEDFLFEQFDGESPIGSHGDHIFRQVNLPGYGVMDLVSIEIVPDYHHGRPNIDVKIYELKKGPIDFSALGQIARYKVGCERMLEEHMGKRYDYEVSGVLVGSSVPPGDIRFLLDQTGWLDYYTFDLTLQEGLTIKEGGGWYRSDEDLTSLPLASRLISEFATALRDSKRMRTEHRKRRSENKLNELIDLLDHHNLEEGTP